MITKEQRASLRAKAEAARIAWGRTEVIDRCTSDHQRDVQQDYRAATRPGTVLQLLAALDRLEEALEKIGDYNTLDGDKYNSYAEGWEGVAAFARQALEEVFGKDET